ncbi:MAG: hypothetical protein J7K32_07650 [Deltaproteobacteria bacterium]|nr:hypothetical protein [Deltaproteobacteria bacterium]
MPNITLSVNDDIIKKVRKIAIDKNTTLTALVRDFLTTIAKQDVQHRKKAAEKIGESFKTKSRNMGVREWTREALHER